MQEMPLPEAASWDGSNHAGSTGAGASATAEKVSHHFYRNPDDKMLGGVVSGLAAYWGWDVTMLRLVLVIIMIFMVKLLDTRLYHLLDNRSGARTAAEKLSMRGEAVTG